MDIFKLGVVKLILTWSCPASACFDVIIPLNCKSPVPLETNPKVPKLQLLFAISAWPPVSQVTASSQHIVNNETNWANPPLVTATPTPPWLYWVNASTFIVFRSLAWSPSIRIPVPVVVSLVQFWIYGPFHLPPPTFSAISVVGNPTAAAGWTWPLKVIFANFTPFLTWNKSLFVVLGRTLTVLWSSPTIAMNAGTSIGFCST